ncbi:MAG: hypothetical protein QM817_35035 [Archangium sp.]
MPNYVAEQLYEKSYRFRAKSLPATDRKYFYYDIITRAGLEYYAIEADTSSFTSLKEESGDVKLIKLDGTDGEKISNLSRNSPYVWCHYPSSLFHPDPEDARATRGFMFVTKEFFETYKLDLKEYATGPDKWPPRLGQPEHALLKQLARAYPGLVLDTLRKMKLTEAEYKRLVQSLGLQ